MPYGTVQADVIGTSVAGSNLGAGNASIMKNRIINGAMVIDQRNAGASVSVQTSTTYLLDRWSVYANQNSKFSVQQNAGSVTLPVGFQNYLGATSSSAYTVGSAEVFTIQQKIEGYNVADLQWGTSNAKTVTLSFQVYSSLTGTFGGSFTNAPENRSYPFTYTVPVANTWTSVSITIAGDTTGTWNKTNSSGLSVFFSLGAGSTVSGTAGSWSANSYYSATGATSVVGTSGATFYITGVQLEVGSSATGFEYVNYQTSLANCQRYYWNAGNVATSAYSNNGVIGFPYPVTMRASPTASFSYSGTTYNIYRIDTGAQQTLSSPTISVTNSALTNMYAFTPSAWASTAGTGFYTSWTFSAEL